MLGLARLKTIIAVATPRKSKEVKQPAVKKPKLREKIEYSRKYEEILELLETKKAERESKLEEKRK
jgi:hypothetical protein